MKYRGYACDNKKLISNQEETETHLRSVDFTIFAILTHGATFAENRRKLSQITMEQRVTASDEI